MTKSRARRDVAPTIRASFIRAVKTLPGTKDCKPGEPRLTDLIQKELIKNPLATLKVMSSFMIKERHVSGSVKHEHDHEHTVIAVQETLERLHEIVAEGEDGDTPSAPEKPMLN